MTRSPQELAQYVRDAACCGRVDQDALSALVALAEAGERYRTELIHVLASSGVPDYLRRNIERALGEGS